MKILTSSVLILLSATTILARRCGWVNREGDGASEGHNLGGCIKGTVCINHKCVMLARIGEACSVDQPCKMEYKCGENGVCIEGKASVGASCNSNDQCESDICIRQVCRDDWACGDDTDCAEGGVCRFTLATPNFSDLGKTVRVCAKPDQSRFGQFCDSNKDCGVLEDTTEDPLSASLKALLSPPQQVSPRFVGPRSQDRRRQLIGTSKVLRDKLECRAKTDKAFDGWPCRDGNDCRSGNCVANTFKQGNLTIKMCEPNKPKN
ncbi:hypothetical protein MGYG_03473 [Nannizzia gypsea CBS 118893]|uniref:Dickkopf N-terminal cysteine-rich domain-containing protein n=1 Tax=Arthroderma gypseum (strain ATCC MYA-4604 / CBS 118893) TaxID=535722 RepID=E4US53_ARTGP|nr:hypothetical protein MGYG_03473 [Nannizzia gypsea CBS 118893]EFR00471.1 hypothetical protein MGYG_03473 [Nannizzia gypsea CBS 118893]